MKVAAVIAEFNPFHNGHKYLINEIREKEGADYVAAFMSGDFVQRGAPALCNKFLRAEAAVRCGVDAVFELPAVYASSAAPDFAFGGVSMANSLGCTDILAFGSECGNTDLLTEAADIMLNEPPEFKAVLNRELRNGSSYPSAVSKALKVIFPRLGCLLDHPNNTLGIEYIKALKRSGSSITPVTFPRYLTSHDQDEMAEDKRSGVCYSGASYIRKCLIEKNPDKSFLKAVPKWVSDLISNSQDSFFPMSSDDFSYPLFIVLEAMDPSDIDLLPGNPDLKAKLKKQIRSYMSFNDLKNKLKDKNFTDKTAGRLLIHALLNISDKDVNRSEGVSYLRLLAMNRQASPLLKRIKENSLVPVITKMADHDISNDPMLLKDIYASDLYEKTVSAKYGCIYKNDIIRSPIIV